MPSKSRRPFKFREIPALVEEQHSLASAPAPYDAGPASAERFDRPCRALFEDNPDFEVLSRGAWWAVGGVADVLCAAEEFAGHSGDVRCISIGRKSCKVMPGTMIAIRLPTCTRNAGNPAGSKP